MRGLTDEMRQPEPLPVSQEEPSGAVAQFGKDLGLAVALAAGLFPAGLLVTGVAAYVFHPAQWPRVAIAVFLAPGLGCFCWYILLAILWFLLMCAGSRLTEDQQKKLVFFPAWQMDSAWREPFDGRAVRARRILAFWAWWIILSVVFWWIVW